MINSPHSWLVAIFAHNEARNIIACLDSLQSATNHPLECFVLANACTDRTEALVREYGANHPNVHLVSIALGDKATHGMCSCTKSHHPGRHDTASLTAMCAPRPARSTPWCSRCRCIRRPMAHRPCQKAGAVLPRSRRHAGPVGVAGNLYGLRGTFVDRIRTQGIKMPIGTIGEDALMGAMLKWDLRGDTRWDNSRVIVAREAGFEFDSVSPWLPRESKRGFFLPPPRTLQHTWLPEQNPGTGHPTGWV